MAIGRRNHLRSNLRVPVFILPSRATSPIRTETEDVSIEGFFCYTPLFLSPGERIKFVLFLPPATVDPNSTSVLCLHGEAEVARVSIGSAPIKYGIACRLKSYRVLPDSELSPTEEAVAIILQSIA